MAMQWFRFWNEFADDPKTQSMPEHMQRRLVMLFCLRSSNVLETLQPEDVAFKLRISEEELQKTVELFIRKGFMNSDWIILNWEKRQFASDSSTLRVRKYRETHGNVSETLPKRSETASDTDTDTEKHTSDLLKKELADCFEKLWKRYPRKDGKKEALRHYNASVKTIDTARVCWEAMSNYLDHIHGSDPRFIKMGSTWFNNWQDWIPEEDENAAA